MGQHGQYRPLVRVALLALGLSLIWTPVASASCRLALILALDVSSSVDASEDQLQRSGLAAALIAPEVQDAFLGSGLPVALSVFEWSGRYNQQLILDWTMIRSPSHLQFAAEQVASSVRSHNDFPTAIGYALGYASGLFREGPDCLFRTIDVAGDGVSNEGFSPELAYKRFDFNGVTVNGLVINAADFEGELNLIEFYQQEVIRGPASFVEIANGFEDYENAMTRKLVREVSSLAIGSLRP